MKAAITHGTYNFLVKLYQKNEGKKLFLMQGEDSVVAYYEGEERLFENAREYETVVTDGEVSQDGFVVMNNIPVTDEGKPIFENQFKERAGMMKSIPGFRALRVLRPLKNNKYVVFVQWDKQDSYEKWKNSEHFSSSHSKKSGERPPYSAGPSYADEYWMINKADLSEA